MGEAAVLVVEEIKTDGVHSRIVLEVHAEDSSEEGEGKEDGGDQREGRVDLQRRVRGVDG